MYAKTKAEALKQIAAMDDSKFPACIVVWDADDIRDEKSSFDPEEGEGEPVPDLTDEEVATVAWRLERNHDSEYGINNERVYNAIEKVLNERNA